jgi:hypothetical protein
MLALKSIFQAKFPRAKKPACILRNAIAINGVGAISYYKKGDRQ